MPETQRGDVWLVDLGLAAKVRPCLVLSVPVAEQDRALVTVVAHTTSPRGSRCEVATPTRFLRPGVFDAQNVVTIPHAKLLRNWVCCFRHNLQRLRQQSVRGWASSSHPVSKCKAPLPNIVVERTAHPRRFCLC
jgi:mRNA interferase MazF